MRLLGGAVMRIHGLLGVVLLAELSKFVCGDCNCITDVEFKGDLPMTAESNLTNFLLSRYKRHGTIARPLLNSSQTIEVEFSLSLIQILDFDETNQVLTTAVWKRYKWRDELLVWETPEFGHITDIRLPSKKVWTPDIVLYNTAADQEKSHQELLMINHKGEVTWIPPTIYRSSCKLNMRNFPFDQQNCSMKFGSWTYDGNALNLSFYGGQNNIDMTEYINNSEWNVRMTSAEHHIRYYNCCGDKPFPDLTFTIIVSRRTAFYVYVLVLPSVLLSFLTLVIFWIPPQRPDRTSFGMSLFSSFFVLLLILVQSSPPASEPISLLGLYYCINMIMIAFSTMVSAVVIFLRQDKQTRPVPWLLKLVFVRFLGCCSPNSTPKQQQHLIQKPTLIRERQLLMTQEKADNGKSSDTTEVPLPVTSTIEQATANLLTLSNREEWKMVADVIDRLFFVIYSIGIFLSLIFVFPSPCYNETSRI